jgi:class 3 adenylate cyclase
MAAAWDNLALDNALAASGLLSEFDLLNFETRKEKFQARMADFALHILSKVIKFNEVHGTQIYVSMGIDCGPIVAGVIGRKKFAYDIWGGMLSKKKIFDE